MESRARKFGGIGLFLVIVVIVSVIAGCSLGPKYHYYQGGVVAGNQIQNLIVREDINTGKIEYLSLDGWKAPVQLPATPPASVPTPSKEGK